MTKTVVERGIVAGHNQSDRAIVPRRREFNRSLHQGEGVKKSCCHAEPFAVTLSEAKGPQFAHSG